MKRFSAPAKVMVSTTTRTGWNFYHRVEAFLAANLGRPFAHSGEIVEVRPPLGEAR